MSLWLLPLPNCAEVSERPRRLPIGLRGVWNWRGKRGKVEGAHQGSWHDIKGPIADLDLIRWAGREATIIFDSNVTENQNVKAARRHLSRELRERGARVSYLDLP